MISKVFQKEFRLSMEDYFELHLRLLNCLFNVRMSDTELRVLSGFMIFGIGDDGLISRELFSDKSLVRDFLDGMSSSSLSQHLKSLEVKGFLYRDGLSDRLFIRDFLIPNVGVQGYQFKLVAV